MFGILGGIGAHPEDVAHMKRTADRLFGDDYRWSVLGAGRNQMRDRRAGGGDGRQRPRRARGFALGRAGASWPSPTPSRCAGAQIIEGLGLEVATPDEAREILDLKGGDKVAF